MKMTAIAMMLSMGLAACGGDDTGGGTGGTSGGTTTGGAGDIPCAQPTDPNNGRVACPGGSPTSDTALPTLTALKQVAEGTGEDVKWLGGMLGQQIARDGTPTGGVLTLWMAGFCLGGTSAMDLGDALNLSTNGTECLAERQCMALDCSVSPVYPVPTVDVDAAIQTAFPTDPAGTTYGINYTAAIGNYWTITSSASSTSVKIDGSTGAVVP